MLHPVPSILTAAAAVGFAWIFGLSFADARIWWIAAIMLLAQFSISVLNDWADADLDAKAGRPRPVPLRVVSRGAALVIAVVCAVGALVLSAISGFGLVPFLLVVIGIGCGWVYDLRLKRTPLSFLPFAVAFPLMPLWVGVIAGHPLSSLGVILLAGAPLATAIHLADAIPDREADRAAGVKTLAVALGSPRAEFAAAGLLLIGSVITITTAIRRGNGLVALWLPGIALSYLVISLTGRETARSWTPVFGKWVLIAAAILVALALVVSVSGR
jgi:4-hydroxybenzoate polyprenyltransferase